MATPTTNLVDFSNVTIPADLFTASLVHGTKWGDGAEGSSVELSYSFPLEVDAGPFFDPDYDFGAGGPNEWELGFSGLDTTQMSAFEYALGRISAVADITFVELADKSTEVGEIRVGFSELVDAYGAGAWAYLPGDFPAAGDVWMNPEISLYGDWGYGSWDFNTVLHELGHALGLKHPFDTDNINTNNGAPVLPTAFDNIFYTVMSYTDDPSGNEFFISRYPDTPMVFDIQALQYLYGPNATHNTGNDQYQFDENGLYFETIWDAGGTDSIRYNSTTGGKIDLRAGKASELGEAVDFAEYGGGPVVFEDNRTVWIAYGADIENAYGGSGDDLIIGNDLDNDLYGYAGDDVLYGFAGMDDLHGGDDNDRLLGGDGNDDIFGDAGNDLLIGGPGNDTLDGGSGNDSADYRATTTAVTVDLSIAGTQDTAGAGIDTLSGIEHLYGSGLDDFLLGDANANRIYGESGDDRIEGGDGNDSLFGGSGEDTAEYRTAGGAVTVDLAITTAQDTVGAGTDTLNDIENLNGSVFADVLKGDGSGNVLDGHTGDDTLYGRGGGDTYRVDSALDQVFETASSGNDSVYAGAAFTLPDNVEDLYLTIAAGAVNGTGNTLDNRVAGNDAANTLYGDSGDDTLRGHGDGDILFGQSGHDTLHGGDGNDDLWGGDGNDTLYGDNGTDSLYGGNGNDLYLPDDNLDSIHEQIASGTDTVQTGFDFTLPDNVETLQFTGTADLTGDGNGMDNVLHGNSGDDTLSGLAGHDRLYGNNGQDWLSGGDGNDHLYGNNGDDQLNGDTGNDRLTGGIGNDSFDGGSGNDVLSGGSGNDVLDGGAGDDIYYGGDGDDQFDVDSALDLVFETLTGGDDLVASTATFTLPDHVESLALHEDGQAIDGTGNELDNFIQGNSYANALDGSSGDDTLWGLGGNDTLYGGDGHDQLLGFDGDDQLRGGDGNDDLFGEGGTNSLYGGAGNDAFILEDGNDTVFELAGQGIDKIQSELTVTLPEHVENLVLAGFANADGTGNKLDNNISGNGGANQLSGAAGNDSITGSSGDDILLGGDGNDVLDGDADDDNIAGNNGADKLKGGFGNDTLYGGDGNDRLGGNNDDDWLDGQGGNDELYGGPGDDVLLYDFDDSRIDGGTGNDTLLVVGSDTVLFLDGVSGTSLVDIEIIDISGSGANTLVLEKQSLSDLSTESNTLRVAGDNDDQVSANGIWAYISTVSIEATNYVEYAQGAVRLQVQDSVLFDALIVNGPGGDPGEPDDGPLDLAGTPGDDYINGSGFDDTIRALSGDDLVQGGSGADFLLGHAGHDIIIADADDDIVNGGGGNDILMGGDGNDRVIGTGGDDLLYGGDGDDTVNGGGGTDTLFGGDGADLLVGSLGGDALYGGDGNDTLIGHRGVDILDGGEGSDTYRVFLFEDAVDTWRDTGTGVTDIDTLDSSTVSLLLFPDVFSLAGNGIEVIQGNTINGTVLAGIGTPLHWDFSGITLTNISLLRGSTTEDVITGTAGNDIIAGRLGDDSLAGGDGDDRLLAHGGDDMAAGDGGHDVINGGGGNDTLDGGDGNDRLVAAAGDDDLEGAAGNDLLNGGLGNDTLNGGDGEDRLIGGPGDDVLSGAAGNDTLNGLAGDDTFVFDNAPAADNIDTLVGFGPGDDVMHLDAGIFTALATLPGNGLAAGEFHASADGTAANGDDRILYNTTTGGLFYDADGSGGADPVAFAVLAGAPLIDTEDLLVI